MLTHHDVERVDLSVGCTHGTMLLEKLVGIGLFYQKWVKLPDHGEALELLRITQLCLQGHPTSSLENLAECPFDSSYEGLTVSTVDGNHPVKPPGQTSMVSRSVLLKWHAQIGVWQ